MLSPTRLSLLTLTALVVACGAPLEQSDASAGPTPARGNTSGVVLTGADLYEHGGTLLSYLYGRVSGMSVDYSSVPCPSVQLRGRKSMFGSNNPVVYVDGARTVNICVLEMLHTRDVTRVEVYPMGVANQPGYESHPNGLILVFVRDRPGDPENYSRRSD